MDIVERLGRQWAELDPADEYRIDARDAIEEIEQLRADTQEVAAARAYLRERDGLLREIAALHATIEAEREACAKVCEGADRYRGEYFAAKIRARSTS